MGVQYNDSNIRAKLEQLKQNLPTALRAAGVSLLLDAVDTIKNGGNGWAPFKRLPKRPHQLLYDTGQLIQSLNVGGPGNIFELNGDSLTIGTNVAYARAMNDGYAPRNLPARPFLELTDDRIENAAKAFKKALLRGL